MRSSPRKLLGPNWVARRAVEWINANADRPFLLTCGWIKPHPPWNIPANRAGLYADRTLPEPIPRSRVAPFPTEESELYGDGDSEAERRQIREAYYTSIPSSMKPLAKSSTRSKLAACSTTP